MNTKILIWMLTLFLIATAVHATTTTITYNSSYVVDSASVGSIRGTSIGNAHKYYYVGGTHFTDDTVETIWSYLTLNVSSLLSVGKLSELVIVPYKIINTWGHEPRNMNVYGITNTTWSFSTLTWANRPLASTSLLDNSSKWNNSVLTAPNETIALNATGWLFNYSEDGLLSFMFNGTYNFTWLDDVCNPTSSCSETGGFSLHDFAGGSSYPNMYFNITYILLDILWSNNQTSIQTPYKNQPSTINITWTITPDEPIETVYLESNYSGTPTNYSMSNPTGDVYSYTNTFSAGNFYWKSYAINDYGGRNESQVFNVIIEKAQTYCNITLKNETNTLVNQNISNLAMSITNISANCNFGEPTLYLDGSSISNPSLLYLNVSTHLVYANISSSENYTSNITPTYGVLVNKITNACHLNFSWGGNTYTDVNKSAESNDLITTTAYCTGATPTLYYDGGLVANPHTVTHGVAIHSYKANTTGNDNYTSVANFTRYLNISEATIIVDGGGGGGGGGGGDPDLNISFVIEPNGLNVSIRSGSSRTIEFEVVNTGSEDLNASIYVVGGDAQSWISFGNYTRLDGVPVNTGRLLESDRKFIRYTVRVPEDIYLGNYSTTIIVESSGITHEYYLTVGIVEGYWSEFLALWTHPLWSWTTSGFLCVKDPFNDNETMVNMNMSETPKGCVSVPETIRITVGTIIIIAIIILVLLGLNRFGVFGKGKMPTLT